MQRPFRTFIGVDLGGGKDVYKRQQHDPAALAELTEIVFVQRYYQRFADDIAEHEEKQADHTAVL